MQNSADFGPCWCCRERSGNCRCEKRPKCIRKGKCVKHCGCTDCEYCGVKGAERLGLGDYARA